MVSFLSLTFMSIILVRSYLSLRISSEYVVLVFRFELGMYNFFCYLYAFDVLQIVEDLATYNSSDAIKLMQLKRRYLGLEVKYELRLLGSHHMEEPCHSLCMVDPFSETFLPCSCTMCSLKTLPVDDSWLRDVLQCLEHASKHWSQCCGYTDCRSIFLFV